MTELFTPKPFAEIAADMIERMRVSTDKVTDFNVGSVVRCLLEAGAVELDDYYQEMYFGLLKAIPAAIYIGFDFDTKPAVAAAGVAKLTRVATDSALTIPAGTVFTAPNGATYTSGADAVFTIGETTTTTAITADQEGANGNAGPGTLTLSVSVSADVTAANPAVISGGQDQETEEQRAERFAAFIRALARGTPAALEYGASLPALTHPVTGVLAERVQRSAVNETPGHVELYIHNGSYGASAELIAAVQEQIDGVRDGEDWLGGYRPVGTRVDVEVMTDRVIDLALELSGQGLAAQVEAALGLALRSAVHGDLVRPIDLINVALGVDGVLGATLVAPTETLVVGAGEVLMLGELSLTWTE